MENFYPKYALLNDSQIADGFHRLFSVILSLSWGKNARCKKKISDHGITFYKDQTNQMPYLVLHYNFQRRFLFFLKFKGYSTQNSIF